MNNSFDFSQLAIRNAALARGMADAGIDAIEQRLIATGKSSDAIAAMRSDLANSFYEKLMTGTVNITSCNA